MKTGEEITLTRSSIFLVIRFVRGSRKIGGAKSSSISLRPSPQALRRPSVMKSEVGGCNHAAISRSRIYLGCSTRSFEAGSTITGDSIALPCICRYSNWTKRWRVGRHRNSRGFAVVNDVHIDVSPGCPGVLRRCSLTGRWQRSVLLWEPYEWRHSRPVPREREGEIPSRSSPTNWKSHYPHRPNRRTEDNARHFRLSGSSFASQS